MSIHPSIQASNPRAGLAQAATVSVYCTYLTLSAVAMEPDDKSCNPLVRATGTRTASVVIGAIVTFVTCAYTTTRAATYGLAMGTGKPSGYGALETEDYGHDMVSTQPESRRAMRQEALRRAVESGALPASALDDSDDDDDDDDDPKSGKHKNDDEKQRTQYNYALFHVIFMLATAWIATLLTQNISGDKKIDEQHDFVPVGRTYWASWVKIISAWVCYGIFGWTLAAPVILPDRFDY